MDHERLHSKAHVQMCCALQKRGNKDAGVRRCKHQLSRTRSTGSTQGFGMYPGDSYLATLTACGCSCAQAMHACEAGYGAAGSCPGTPCACLVLQKPSCQERNFLRVETSVNGSGAGSAIDAQHVLQPALCLFAAEPNTVQGNASVVAQLYDSSDCGCCCIPACCVPLGVNWCES